ASDSGAFGTIAVSSLVRILTPDPAPVDNARGLPCHKRFQTKVDLMPHCLVTGGAGFIGSHLTEYLLARGHEVSVLDDLSTGREDNLQAVAGHPRLHVRTGSITDPILLADVVRSVEVIFHLAAAVGVRLVADDPVRTIETNIY